MIYKNKRLKIISANLFKTDLKIQPGQFKEGNKDLLLGCASGVLKLDQIQPEGKKILTANEFINGFLR